MACQSNPHPPDRPSTRDRLMAFCVKAAQAPLMEVEDLQVERRRRFRGARRAVIKLGTSVVSSAGGEVSAERVAPVVRALAELHAEGRGLVLVSSGAVGLGAGRLGLARARLGDVVVRQACAAVGQ